MSGSKRVRKYLIPAILIVVLAVSVAAYMSNSIGNQPKANPNGVYVGVAFGGETVQEARHNVDYAPLGGEQCRVQLSLQ